MTVEAEMGARGPAQECPQPLGWRWQQDPHLSLGREHSLAHAWTWTSGLQICVRINAGCDHSPRTLM